MKKTHRIFSVILTAIILINTICIFAYSKDNEHTLTFNENGTFRIMHITDTHFTDFPFEESVAFIEKALDEYKPDLVVFGGDNIKGWFDTSMLLGTKTAIDKLIAPVAQRDIPFTFVYGNHDREAYFSPKLMQNSFYTAYKGCIAPNGYSSVSRTANGNILIKDSKGEKNIFNIWLFDSGTKIKSDIKTTIQCVNTAEIKWYEKKSNELKAANDGSIIPSIAFQHLGFEEVKKLFIEDESGVISGDKAYRLKDGITDTIENGRQGIENTKMTTHLNKGCELSTVNDGQYSAFVKQGDVIGVFFGHTHVNDFCGITEDNIILGATLSAGGFNIAARFTDETGNQIEARGLRIIDIDEASLTDGDGDNLEAISTFSVYYTDYFSDSVEKYPAKYKGNDEHDISEWFKIEFDYLIDFIKSVFTHT